MDCAINSRVFADESYVYEMKHAARAAGFCRGEGETKAWPLVVDFTEET